MGDFDSLGYRPDHPNVRSFRPEKDFTDMHIAVKEGMALGYKHFVIFGGTGSTSLAYHGEYTAAGRAGIRRL